MNGRPLSQPHLATMNTWLCRSGLANSPSVFQSFINDVFRDMIDRWVIVYIDDILIYSNLLKEHVQHVRFILKRQYQLYAKAEKCEFHQTSTSFLGYIISQEGVAMDERKVKAMLDWPQPRTVKGISWVRQHTTIVKS